MEGGGDHTLQWSDRQLQPIPYQLNSTYPQLPERSGPESSKGGLVAAEPAGASYTRMVMSVELTPHAWVRLPAVSLHCCVTLSELGNLSVPPFPHL